MMTFGISLQFPVLFPVWVSSAEHYWVTFAKRPHWDPHGRWMADLEPCLRHLDFLFLNEDEARMITHSSSPSEAARIVLEKGVRTAVMKLGRRGCAIYTRAHEIFCPAFEVNAHDTTGALRSS